jgi:PST family polysaccharide transporter
MLIISFFIDLYNNALFSKTSRQGISIYSKMTLKRQVVNGTLWAAMESWGQQFANLLIFLVLARLLGPEAYGLMGMAVVILAFNELLIAKGGWSEALIQRPQLESAHSTAIFWFLLLFAVFLMAATVMLAPWVANLFAEPKVSGLASWLSLTLPLSALAAVPDALLRRHLQFAPLTTRSLVSAICGGVVGIAGALFGFGVWSLVGQQITQKVVSVVVLWRATTWRPGWQFSWQHYKDLHAFSLNSLGERLLICTDQVALRFAIGYVLGAASLGYYVLARKILEILNELLLNPLLKIALPAFSQLQTDSLRTQQALTLGTQLAVLVGFPSFTGVVLVAPQLIPIAFGSDWQNSVAVLQILALMALVNPFIYFNAVLMRAQGQVSSQFMLSAVATFLLFVLVLPFTGRGLLAVALALLARAYMMFPIRLWVTHRVIKIAVFEEVKQCLPIFAATLVMVVVVLFLQHWFTLKLSPLLALLMCVAVGAISYLATLYGLARPLLQQTARFIRLTKLSDSPAPQTGVTTRVTH